MKILIIEPYFTGSHAAWAHGYQNHSRHQIEILSLTGQYWKWRMHGGAVTLAHCFLKIKQLPDLILATDMLDLTTFLSLTRKHTSDIPIAIYFHENQLCYPWSPEDRDVQNNRDKHYGFINYTSALATDALLFNSKYHQQAFFAELLLLLKHFPDHRGLDNVEKIKHKSSVLYLGLDLEKFDNFKSETKNETPLILWNHRWEYDKNPTDFFNALFALADRGLKFQIAVLGENFSNQPEKFENARARLGSRVRQFGFADSFEDYAHWLLKSDIIPVTSIQDFFGASTVEAIYCGAYPLLPNRLAFPEIFSLKNNPDNFYESFDQLVEKLSWAVKNIKFIRQQTFRNYVEKYSWKIMAEQYDSFWENFAKQ